MDAVVDRILPQDDRTEERRIPILPGIDERLYENRIEGYRFADMPSDQEAYRIAARAFEEMAQTLHGRAFHELEGREQEEILKSIHQAKPQRRARAVEADEHQALLDTARGRRRSSLLRASVGVG